MTAKPAPIIPRSLETQAAHELAAWLLAEEEERTTRAAYEAATAKLATIRDKMRATANAIKATARAPVAGPSSPPPGITVAPVPGPAMPIPMAPGGELEDAGEEVLRHMMNGAVSPAAVPGVE